VIPESVSFSRYYAVIYALFPVALVTSITSMDLCLILLFLGWMAELMIHGRRRAWNSRVAWMVALFLALLLIPELIHFSWNGLNELVIHHYRKVFLVLIMVGTLRTAGFLDRTLDLWVAAGGLIGMLTVAAYGTEGAFLNRFLRGTGGPHSPLVGNGLGHWKSVQFGNVLAFVLPFGLFQVGRYLTRGRRWRAGLLGAACLGIAGGILVSFTLTPLAGTLLLLVGIGIGWVTAWIGGDPGGFRGVSPASIAVLIAVLVVLLTGGVWMTWPTLQGEVGPLWSDPLAHPGVQQRLALWREVLRQVGEQPVTMLLGSGTDRGMAAFYYQADRPLVMVHGTRGLFRKHAHNNLVQYLLDYGLFGVVAYLMFWGYLLWELLAGEFPHRLRWYRYSGLALIFIVNVCGLTEYNWGRSPTHYNIAFGVGLVLAARWYDPAGDDDA